MRALLSVLPLAFLLTVHPSQAEILYDQDGIQFQASFRVTHYNAYTCDVPEDRVPEKKYEQIKDNHGQPIHIWQVSYSVYNSTQKGLDYLRAFVEIDSNWPPCHSWTANPDLRMPGAIEWAGHWGLIQMPNGMRPLQAVQEETYLLIFHTEQPLIDRWDINYTFDDDPAPGGSRQTRQESPPPRSRQAAPQPEPAPRPAPKPEPDIPEQDRCKGKSPGDSCWVELSDKPGCYVWDQVREDAIMSWTGECAKGLAQGSGTLRWSGGSYEVVEKGTLDKGKRHGEWSSEVSNGDREWVTYTQGIRNGLWAGYEEESKLSWTGQYCDGQRCNEWTAYDRRGRPVGRTNYD